MSSAGQASPIGGAQLGSGRPTPVGFSVAGVHPPSALYVGAEDRLILTIYSAESGVTVAVRARFLGPDGQVTPQVFTLAAGSARAQERRLFDLGEGFLLGCIVTVDSGTARRGQVFAHVGLGRGTAAAAEMVHTLIADYVTSGVGLAWPGGQIRQSVEGRGMLRSVTGTDPAAGAEVSEAVPTNARWLLHGVRLTLVTDATAANRRVHLSIQNELTVPLLDLAAGDVQAASLTRRYNCEPAGFQRTAADNEIYLPLPRPLPLLQGWIIATVTTNLQAGDNFQAPRLYVEEWLEE